MKLSPWSLVKEIATLAYLMLTLSAIPKMPQGASSAINGSAYQFATMKTQTNQLNSDRSPSSDMVNCSNHALCDEGA